MCTDLTDKHFSVSPSLDEEKIGVYFSANDAVYEWAIAFLNSFRSFNPDLRLILIPFNKECEQLLELRNRYKFEIYTDVSFSELEDIGQSFELGFTPTGPFWFRRYAAFWGPLDTFLYLDVRQIVLADLRPVLVALTEYGFDFLHFDCSVNQVYEPGLLRQSLLKQGKARGFNSGRWASRKGLFSLEEFKKLADEALKVRNQLNPRNTDQAFINYCCDIKPVRYGHVAEVLGGICQSAWACQPGKIYRQSGKYYLWDYGGLDHKKQILLLHWAGCKLNALVPHKYLFYHFQLQNQSYGKQGLIFLKDGLEYLLRLPIELIRRNRFVNTLYHNGL